MTRRLFPGYGKDENGVQSGETATGNNQRGSSSSNDNSNHFSQIQDVTLEYLAQMESYSAFFANATSAANKRCIPCFAPQEVQLGVMLGQGEFGILLRVQGIKLRKEQDTDTTRRSDGVVDDDCCSSSPLDHHHRLVSSSINLPAISGLQLDGAEKDVYNNRTGSTTKSVGSSISARRFSKEAPEMNDDKQHQFQSTPPPPHHRVTQSVTISKLAHPPPLPIEQRTHRTAQGHHHTTSTRTSVFSGKGEKEQEESLRLNLVQQVTSNATASVSNGRRLLALKQVRKDLYPNKKLEAAKDLAREAKFLAQMHHDNIITLRGTVSQPGLLEFGMLLDRLGVTLAEQVSAWHARQEDIVTANHLPVVTPVLEAFSSLFQPKADESSAEISLNFATYQKPPQQHYTQKALQLLGERVLALWDIARGMEYLHKHKILFRDLKTENVGTLLVNSGGGDNHDDSPTHLQQRMQIFDFGLAKECKASNVVLASDIEDGFYSTYKMTGLTGTLRIMAPEVIQCLPYGLPADVFSFGVCMWEIFSATNNNGLTAAETCKGKRPAIPSMDRNSGAGMPPALQWLLKRCWAQDAMQRPTFCDIERQLHGQLLELQRLENQLPKSRGSSRSASPLNFGPPDATPSQVQGAPRTVAVQASVWKRLATIHSSNALDEQQGTPLVSVTDS